jgi:plastocyanin
MIRRAFLTLGTAGALCLAMAAPVAAQTTHNVTVGPGFTFAPADLSIQVGDTVKWTWAGTFFHNVESGVGSVHDGIFTSGAPVAGAGTTFSVTFNSAFLAANPTTGNNYPYYCIVHEAVFNMEGVVRVTTGYGCTAPAGSLNNVNGGPHVGKSWQVSVHNPVPGGQTPGSLAFVGVATQPSPGFPCGLPVPGFHMDPAQATGELLLSLTPPNPLVTVGPGIWTGTPVTLSIAIPPTPPLVGLELYAQGLIVDGVGPNLFGASTALRATIGA